MCFSVFHQQFNLERLPQKFLILFQTPSYVDEPCIPITISDATTLVTILEWSNIFATNELINIFPLLKKTNHEDREKILCSLHMAGADLITSCNAITTNLTTAIG